MLEAVHLLATPNPILLGHSFMGFITQKYLESNAAAGVVLLDSFPPTPTLSAARCLEWMRKGGEKEEEDSTFPWRAIREMEEKEAAVRLEPQSTEWLLLHSTTHPPSSHPFLGMEDIEETVSFHGIEKDCMKGVGRGEGKRIDEVAEAVYEWYDERF